MPQLQQRNAFFMFMQYYRKRETKKGLRFRGYQDLVVPASAEWVTLTLEEKEFFKQEAKKIKSVPEGRRVGKKATKIKNVNLQQPQNPAAKPGEATTSTASSTDIQDLDFCDEENFFLPNFESRAIERLNTMKNDLKIRLEWSIVDDFTKIYSQTFFIVSVQNYYELYEERYAAPVEIAVVQFSLQEGIIDEKHVLLKPLNISEEMTNEIASKALNTHKINLHSPPTVLRADYRKVAEEFKKLYKDLPSYYMFALSAEYNSVQAATKAIRQEIDSKLFIPHQNVNCVENLYEILMEFSKQETSPYDALRFKSLTEKCGWDNEPQLYCSWHQVKHLKKCALATARKTCYLLFTLLADAYKLNLTTKHIPTLIRGKEFSCHYLESEIIKFDQNKNIRTESEYLSYDQSTIYGDDGESCILDDVITEELEEQFDQLFLNKSSVDSASNIVNVQTSPASGAQKVGRNFAVRKPKSRYAALLSIEVQKSTSNQISRLLEHLHHHKNKNLCIESGMLMLS